jgi:hypothetical protein
VTRALATRAASLGTTEAPGAPRTPVSPVDAALALAFALAFSARRRYAAEQA